MYTVKWMPKTAAELEELCNKGLEHGFRLVACNDKFCVFESAQQSVEPTVSKMPDNVRNNYIFNKIALPE